MADDCLFCKIAAGQLPSDVVYSDDEFFAFRDIHPAAPTHVLIIPRKHIPMITDVEAADAELVGKMFLVASEIARKEGLTENGFRCVFNCGKWAGQAVFHIHLHLLGGRPLSWPPG